MGPVTLRMMGEMEKKMGASPDKVPDLEHFFIFVFQMRVLFYIFIIFFCGIMQRS